MNLATLLTESRNPATEHIDELPTLDMLRLINNEDAKVAQAVAAVLPEIAKAIDELTRRLNDGGSLFYIGAGTSGRLGVLDASEIPPTFSVPATLVQGLIAGGDSALRNSSEKSEDSPEQGAADLAASGFTGQDALVDIAASSRTPYVLGALQHANPLGALTIALTCVPNSQMAALTDIAITPLTGPEVLTGSTRLKARPQHALHRRHDQNRGRLRQPHAQRPTHQRQAHRPSPAHHHGRHQHRSTRR